MLLTAKPLTLRASAEFVLAKSLLGSAEVSDELLADLEWRIASQSECFPIVALPETRMACCRFSLGHEQVMVAVFFRRIDACLLELEHLCLERSAPSQLVFRSASTVLPVAA